MGCTRPCISCTTIIVTTMCASVSVTVLKVYYADLVFSCTGDDTLLCITSLRQKMVQDESVVPIEVRRDCVFGCLKRSSQKEV